MKKSCLTAVLMLTSLFALGVSADAQETVVVNVPFAFVAGGVTLPAGDYRINRIAPGTNQELLISSFDKGEAFLLPTSVDRVTAHEPTLSFEHVGGKYFLTKVNTLDGVYSMPTSKEKVMLGQVSTPNAMPPSGTK